ncbi:MAG: LytTR family DNA-binding domain-containing protein, partial [Flavobacteriaceae bacterium]
PEIIKLHSKAVVRVRDIYFLKSDDKYVEYHTKSKCEIERIALKEALEQLPAQQFVQCHKSYVVNLLQIRQVYADKIIMQQGETLPLSRTFKTQMSALMH